MEEEHRAFIAVLLASHSNLMAFNNEKKSYSKVFSISFSVCSCREVWFSDKPVHLFFPSRYFPKKITDYFRQTTAAYFLEQLRWRKSLHVGEKKMAWFSKSSVNFSKAPRWFLYFDISKWSIKFFLALGSAIVQTKLACS